jgi:hypothetical protein
MAFLAGQLVDSLAAVRRDLETLSSESFARESCNSRSAVELQLREDPRLRTLDAKLLQILLSCWRLYSG